MKDETRGLVNEHSEYVVSEEDKLQEALQEVGWQHGKIRSQAEAEVKRIQEEVRGPLENKIRKLNNTIENLREEKKLLKHKLISERAATQKRIEESINKKTNISCILREFTTLG